MIDEIHQGIVLQQVILNWRAAEQDSPLRLQSNERLVGLILAVLQSMALVAEHQANLVLMQYVRVQPERLVADYQNGIDASTSIGLHETRELLVDVRLRAAVDCQWFDAIRQPLEDLVVPILHQGTWGYDNRLLDQWLCLRT